jgi:hypothetical protein
MTREEIQPYLDVGNSHSVCVDISLVVGLPSMVRLVSICKPYEAEIKYYTYGLHEAPLRSRRSFPTLNEVVIFLEQYLGRGIETWENFNKTGNYPERTGQEVETIKFDTWWQMSNYLEKNLPEGFSEFTR